MDKRAKPTMWILLMLLSVATLATAQSSDPPSQLLNAYRNERTVWFTNIAPAANTLFGLLALIDFAWSGAVMVLENHDFHSWVAALIRRIMTIGAFYALLIYGRWWIPAIVDSFEKLGQQAAGTGPLDPGQVFTRGLNISGALLDGASSAGLFTNFGAAMALVFAAAMCLLGFCAITIQFVMAMVESYILVAAAFVFLGFGGSRWSSPYVERYISLAVSIGVKIMLLYLLISTGMTLSSTWLTQAETVGNSMQPATDAFSVMGASLIFAALCWHTPKLLASILGGTPSLHGSDIISPIGTAVAGATVLASGVGAAWRGAMSVTQAAGLGATAAASAGGRESLSGIPAGAPNRTPSAPAHPAPRVPGETNPSGGPRTVRPPASGTANGSDVKDKNDSEGKVA